MITKSCTLLFCILILFIRSMKSGHVNYPLSKANGLPASQTS